MPVVRERKINKCASKFVLFLKKLLMNVPKMEDNFNIMLSKLKVFKIMLKPFIQIFYYELNGSDLFIRLFFHTNQ